MAMTFQVGPPQMQQPRFFHMPRLNQPQIAPRPRYIPYSGNRWVPPRQRFPYQNHQHQQEHGGEVKSSKKSMHRKTVDYNAAVVKYLENRIWQRGPQDMRAIEPDPVYVHELVPPINYAHNLMNCVCTRFIRQSMNKARCPIFCVAWTPEGRRLVTGASSGEFTLWNGLTFNFETILQAHNAAIRSMIWSHNDQWMVTGDHSGFIKYWQSNMNNVKAFQAHPEAIRGLSFCPSDTKFTSCGDDGTVRLWDFNRCAEERVLRGHGADVRCVDWHPQKALIASGSKDSQQPIKLWDPKTGHGLHTIHAHKNTVMQLKWSPNGNWLLTASRDHTIKLFDIRNIKEELQTFKGHKKEASAIAWHPIYENLFASGGADGAIMYWVVGTDKEVGAIEEAHEHVIWTLDWHPMGHILVSGSNDHTVKFWTRNRPGDKMTDKYNLNIQPVGGTTEESIETGDDSTSALGATNIPGMGIAPQEALQLQEQENEQDESGIPGLTWSADKQEFHQQVVDKIKQQQTIPKPKAVSKAFQEAWSSGKTILPIGPGPNQGQGILGERPPIKQPQQPRPALLGDRPPSLIQNPMSGPRMPGPPQMPPRQGGLLGDKPGLLNKPGVEQHEPPISKDEDFRKFANDRPMEQFHDSDLRSQEFVGDNGQDYGGYNENIDEDYRDLDERQPPRDIDDRGFPPLQAHDTFNQEAYNNDNLNEYREYDEPYGAPHEFGEHGMPLGQGRMNDRGRGPRNRNESPRHDPRNNRGRSESPRGPPRGLLPPPDVPDMPPGGRKRQYDESQGHQRDDYRGRGRGNHRGGRGVERGGRGGPGGRNQRH